MSTLDLILSIITLATGTLAQFVSGGGSVGAAAKIAEALSQIAQKAVQAYEQHSGQSYDALAATIKPIDPVA